MTFDKRFPYYHPDTNTGGAHRGPTKQHRWQQLRDLMTLERPYLNTQLMQDDIALRLGISSRTLSRLLHRHSENNFNGFVNAYRLAEAERMICDRQYTNLTIEAIATRCGFNSRGVFYRAFRDRRGMSPLEYRAQCTEVG